MNRSPLAFSLRAALVPPAASDKTADTDRVAQHLAGLGFDNVEIPLGIVRRLPEELRRNSFNIDLVLGVTEGRTRILDIGSQPVHGIALDIGSTNIDCSLFNLRTGEKLITLDSENPQTAHGSDVLTRSQKAMLGDGEMLAAELLGGINALILDACSRCGVSPMSVYAATVAGNTIMSHFFLGLDVRNIPLTPYVPAIHRGIFSTGRETGLAIHENGVAYVFPNAGSYVGGDIISGILVSGLYRETDPSLFIDVGTNAEIVLGCRDWIMAGAGAAGPALEEGIAAIGRTAEEGAITAVHIRENQIELEVIGNSEPTGICGSGMIDLIAELYENRLIDQTGKFAASHPRIVEKDSIKTFIIHKSGGRSLFITEREIENFLRSKAAMFSSLYVFVKSLGLSFRDIKKVFVAGALGCGIDPEKAVSIGLLPDIPRDRFIPLGNSSLQGAEMLLFNSGLISDINSFLPSITYKTMHEDPLLMKVFQGALFIPHTNPDILKG